MILTLPFPYYLISLSSSVSSDSELLYWTSLFALLIAVIISFIISKLKNAFKTETILRTFIAYSLSFFLLKYGIDKLLLQQFYTPKPNTLFTPVGQLSKDILFWTSMGTSKTYNWFMAMLEIIPGLLLLHSKTRELGALIASGVLLNVFMINVGFDISVKLFSFYLLASSFYLIQPFTLKLIRLVVYKQEVQLNSETPLLHPESMTKRILKSAVICFFVLEISLPNINQPAQQNELIGTYELESPTILFGQRAKRFHVHSEDFFIIENTDGHFTDFKSRITGNYLYILNKKRGFQINQKAELTEFRMIRENEVSSIKTTQIDLSKLPLLQDDFHWTVEGMIGSN